MSRFGSIWNAPGTKPQNQPPQGGAGDDELVDETGDDEGQEPVKQRQQNINPQLQEQYLVAGERRLLARLAADPEVRKVLEAKQQGKKFRVLSDSDSTVDRGDNNRGQQDNNQGDEESDQVVDLDSLDNRGLANHILKSVGKVLDQKLGKVLEPLQEQTKQFGQYAQQRENERILSEIEKVKEEFPDFDQYREKMHDLSTRNSDLSVRELYLLTKSRMGHPIQKDRRTESEYPSTSVSRPGTHTKVKNLRPGLQGISQLLDASLSRRREEMAAELDQLD